MALQESQELRYTHTSLANDRTKGAWFQISRVHRNGNKQVALLELGVAASLPYMMEASALQSANHSPGSEDWKPRHRRGWRHSHSVGIQQLRSLAQRNGDLLQEGQGATRVGEATSRSRQSETKPDSSRRMTLLNTKPLSVIGLSPDLACPVGISHSGLYLLGRTDSL
jgi:hypothetical protein